MPRVLLAEDDQDISVPLARALRREGYELLSAETTADALRVLREREVHAILSDYKMPGTTGTAFLAEAARLRPDAARMLITGATQEIPEAELERAGVCALITKPWDDEKLKATLRRALGLA